MLQSHDANPELEQALIEEELAELEREDKRAKVGKQVSVFESAFQGDPTAISYSDPNTHRFNHYADKQLQHLVIAEEFDFEKIAGMLNYIFRHERSRYTEQSCRERWAEIHKLRQLGTKAEEQKLVDKRANSVASFNDPYSLYNLEERLDKMQEVQPNTVQEQEQSEDQARRYNIFKDSIRVIDDMDQYRKRQGEMRAALAQAQDPSHTVTDKLMHFSPYYERLNEFEVHQEELTPQKMKEIMSVPVEMDRLEKELRVLDMNEELQKKEENRGVKPWRARAEEKKEESGERYEIDDDWEAYESD